MRLHVVFSSEEPVTLPWHYPSLLQGYLYRAIAKARPDLGSLLHDRGLTAEGHRYKMMVFSRLFPRQASPASNGLSMTPPIHWWVSSPLLAPMQALVEALMSENQAILGAANLDVASVEVEPTPDLSGFVWCETISPLVASTAVRDGEKLQKRYLSPYDAAFWQVLAANLQRKAAAFGLPVQPASTVRFKPGHEWRSRLLQVQGTQVRGYEGRFAIEGDPQLLLLAYEAGLGERNSQGFGMFRVLSRRRQAQSGGCPVEERTSHGMPGYSCL
ncbi:MAG: CRISPR-associated endoribonuclease Cas6 [Limnochordales bacterium]|nr:CRISPR-associated endoribonuclease Cas6 [Limnochordales bacterium]